MQGLRIYVHPMVSNTRNLAGDSGITIPLSWIRLIPDWHFYFGIPDEWAKLEKALRLFEGLQNVSLVPQTYFGTWRSLNNEFLDLPSLQRFADNGPCDVDAAWIFVPEVIPAWKALGVMGYGKGEKPKKWPTLTSPFNGLRLDWRQNNESTILMQAVGMYQADAVMWEAPWHMENSLAYFAEVLNERALERIRQKSEWTGQGIFPDEYEPFPPEKNEVFTIVFNQKLIWQKGADITFRVFDELFKLVGPQFEVWVFDQSQRAGKVADRPYVRIKDGSNRREYQAQVSRCHLCVSHTRFDQWGRSYMDAAMWGAPILCKREMAWPDMLYPGYEWHFETDAECIGYIRYFMEHRDEALAVGRRLREHMLAQFTVERVASRWRRRTEALVAEDVPSCSPERRERILLVAKKLWDKQGPFTKAEFERAFARMYGHTTTGGARGNATKTRRVLLTEYEDDPTAPVPTYRKRGA